MKLKKILILCFGVKMLIVSCSTSKVGQGKLSSPQNGLQSTVVKSFDSTRKVIKPYKDVITDKAITQNGLIKVHKLNERYFFELSDSILDKDMLIVNRISRAAAGFRTEWGGYGGDQIGETVIQFVKGPKDKLFIERKSYREISRDSSQNGMYRSVLNSSLPAIIASFDIKAFSPDSAGSVIEMTEFLNADNDIFSFNTKVKESYKLGGIQIDKSYIQKISSFPLNTEIKTVKTYTHDKDLLTYELNSSIVLLPTKPMKPRYFDPRIGYFARGYMDFDAPQGVDVNYMITRWRLEPKEKDFEKYKNGELVEPQKPIVYYIDPATPQKWVPYLIKGVNAWQKAFEKAGFKNAIYALEAPTNDPTWSLEDARHSAIIYKASPVQNASGPQVSDPRSGEILESHINWYHNVQQLLHDWYFIQASATDPKGRKMEYDDELMGQLIQFVCTHEVGHTLGLMHNFAASSTIPVDSLRSKRYVATNGHTPSIMDYVRFNYVAQPEDSIPQHDLIPRVGVYDEWAIEWGYKWLPTLKTKEEENAYLKSWIVERLSRDNRLMFGDALSPGVNSQAEDLGDDPVKASYYGIKNLKLIMSHLVEWAKTTNNDYSDLARLNNALLNQYASYMMHVLRYIGGQYESIKTADQAGPVWTFVPRKKQKAALQFLQDQLFTTSEWLFDKQIFYLAGNVNQLSISSFQGRMANELNARNLFNNVLFSQLIQHRDEIYSFEEILTDLEEGLFKELKKCEKIDFSRRFLQKSYINDLAFYIRIYKQVPAGILDYCTILNNHLDRLYKRINIAFPKYKDEDSRMHLEDLQTYLKMVLDIQKRDFMLTTRGAHIMGANERIGPPLIQSQIKSTNNFLFNLQEIDKNCWDNSNWLEKVK